ncbi:MAG: carboxylesterase family protein [Myxococcales bacterium]|nr:carboxylesterase family protein [Myxococcales bacterium]
MAQSAPVRLACFFSVFVGLACGVPTPVELDAGAPDDVDAGLPATADSGVDAGLQVPPVDAGSTPAACPQGDGYVATAQGCVHGATSGNTLAYLGVPFAAPPTGALRWRPPAPAAVRSAVLEATAFGAPCAQAGGDGGLVGSEDCLTLNVWTPRAPVSAPRPVMVFVHGGGNMRGSPSDLVNGLRLYDGADLSERGGVVVVTLQYRLNVFGHLSLPGLAAESARGSSGNYALRDLIAGLGWVRDNVRGFGGDPARVLVFGESGGATDTCALVASPLARGLFSSAMVQSGSCLARTRTDVELWGRTVLSAAGCAADSLDCARNLGAQALLTAIAASSSGPGVGLVVPPVGPMIDDEVLPLAPVTAMERGLFDVPVVLGSNADETSAQLFGIPRMLSAQQYTAQVTAQFTPAVAQQVLARYPVSAFATPRAAFVAVTTDAQFTCPTRRVVRLAAASARRPVYRYFYEQVFQGSPILQSLGAAHGVELYLVFQKLDRIPGYTPTAAERSLQTALLSFWTTLAATGTPSGPMGTPAWPQGGGMSDTTMSLRSPPSVVNGVRSSLCDFWDSLQP